MDGGLECLSSHPYWPLPSLGPTTGSLPKNYNICKCSVSPCCLAKLWHPIQNLSGTWRWDTRHTDLWLQCVTSPPSAIHWPCSHCGATNHYPINCPFRPHTVPTPTNESRPSTTSLTSGQHLVTGGHPTLRPATCHAFNRSICCRPNCTFPHRCELCGANHSVYVLPQQRQS